MLFKKSNDTENGELQNQFTAYLITAVRRRRREIIRQQIRRKEWEINVDMQEFLLHVEPQTLLVEDTDDTHVNSFEDMCFENEDLEHALQKLSDRDRYVLFSRIVAEHSFEELAAELGVGYKGVAAVYYRALRKLRKELEDEE